jgi:DNA-directed RNA polymerase subunit alpha
MAKAQTTGKAADILLRPELDVEEALSLRHLVQQSTAEKSALAQLLEDFSGAASGLDEAPLREALARWAMEQEVPEKPLAGSKHPAALLLQSRLAAEAGDHKAALKSAEKAAKAAPTELPCALAPVEELRRLDRIDEAMERLESLRKEFSDRAELAYQEGRLLEELGRQDEAAERYQAAVEQEPDHYRSVFRLAFLADLRGDEETALAYYGKIGPGRSHSFITAAINMALIYEDRTEYDKAAACCRAVLRVAPNNHRAKLFLRDIEESTRMYYSPEEAKETERMEAKLRIPVSDFELSVRSRNCLNRMNIRTLGDLVRKSEQEMLSYKNFGETSLREIKEMLSSRGLRLGMLREDGTPRQETGRRAAPPAAAAPSPTESAPIDELELSVRSRKCMDRLGITTIGELCDLSEGDLIAAKNFGRVSLNEIKQKLAERGLSLKA